MLRFHLNLLLCVSLLVARPPVGIKVTPERFPALVIVFVEPLARLQSPLGHRHAEGRLEHESLKRGELKKNGMLQIRNIRGVPTSVFVCVFHIGSYHCSLSHPLWFQLGGAVLLEALCVRAVGGHDAVQAAPSRLETLLLGLVVTFDQTHELAHAVT